MLAPTRHPVVTALIAAVLTLSQSACVSRLTGNEGNLVFSYVADDEVFDFNKPLAVGAKLDISVREAGTNEVVTLDSAVSDDVKVIDVTSSKASAMTIEGKGEGDTLISVSARNKAGAAVSDAFNFSARKPTKLKLSHYCTTDNTGYYLAGNEVWIPYEMEIASGKSVIGYGYQPVEVVPATAATLDSSNKAQQHLWLKLGASAGKLTLQSQIDATKLELDVVEHGAIDDAVLDGGAFATTAYVGLKHYVLIRPQVGGKPVCQANTDFSAVSTTPDACTATALKVAHSGDGITSAWGWVEITGSKVAKCSFDVTIAKAADGAGITRSFTIDIATVVKP